jgi:hypothetical protein
MARYQGRCHWQSYSSHHVFDPKGQTPLDFAPFASVFLKPSRFNGTFKGTKASFL